MVENELFRQNSNSVAIELELSYNWITMNYTIYIMNWNSCKLSNNTHNIKIWVAMPVAKHLFFHNAKILCNHLISIFFKYFFFLGFWVMLLWIQFMENPFNIHLVEVQTHNFWKTIFVTTFFVHYDVFSPIILNLRFMKHYNPIVCICNLKIYTKHIII